MRRFGEAIRKGLNKLYKQFGWRIIRIAYARADIQDIADTREDFRTLLERDTRVIEDMFVEIRNNRRRSDG